MQNEHIITTQPVTVTVTVTTSSTIQESKSKELNDAEEIEGEGGSGRDLIDKEIEMEMEMVEVMTIGEAVRIEEEINENALLKIIFSVSNSDSSVPQQMVKIVTESKSESASNSVFISPVIHSSTATVDRFDRLDSTLMTMTTADTDTMGEEEKLMKTTYVNSNSNSNNAKNRLSAENGLDNRVCVGVSVSVPVSPNAVRGGRDSDLRTGMVGALSNSDRIDLRPLTNNNSNNNMNKNHYVTNGYDNDDVNDVNNNDSDHNEYNDDREMKSKLGVGVDRYYSKGSPLNQDLRDSRRDFLDTIMA